ncbi:hypothetical protein ACFE04_031961 [Oxalis oulophora]
MARRTTDLHHLLKTLCSDSVWNYSVFWKLKHRSRMVLTLEDAYYENCQQHNISESNRLGGTADDLNQGYLHDPIGLALAKMSYHVYSLGEGIVGQVAVTQKHQWIFADAANSCGSFESSDRLESQFSAGIKTIVVVAVVPHGVVQLGSLIKVTEDMKLVNDVKEAFFALQNVSVGPVTAPIQCNTESLLCLPDLPAASLHSEVFPDHFSVHSKDFDTKSPNLLLQSENFGVNYLFAPSTHPDSAFYGGVKSEHKYSSQNTESHLYDSSENPAKLSHLDSSNTSLKFWAGSELHEALGPAFSKRSTYSDRESEKIEVGATSSQLTFDSGSENLLEAVVANVCNSGSDVKSERSLGKSMQSLLTTDKIPQTSSQTENIISSAGYTLNRSSSSDLYSAMPSKEFSSNCPSVCSEPAKNSNKKRAKPGETSRPRPRDRQLIQDRIKELRELVPNGSKCSIDSLLEHTIKHMLFLQSINKHADKLSKCAEAKMHKKGTSMLGSSNYEQGSSWAMEVGGHLKVCSIVVENLNKNGQMLVEMLCEECSHFLEIAEAIRSIGLTILKGITEPQGDKTWICFIVEVELLNSSYSTHSMF